MCSNQQRLHQQRLHRQPNRHLLLILLQRGVMLYLRIPQVNSSLGKAQVESSASMAVLAKTRSARTPIPVDEELMKILIARYAASEGNAKGRAASLSTHKAVRWMMILPKACAVKASLASDPIACTPTRKGEW